MPKHLFTLELVMDLMSPAFEATFSISSSVIPRKQVHLIDRHKANSQWQCRKEGAPQYMQLEGE